MADHDKGLATREDLVPLFAPHPENIPSLRRVALGAAVSESGDDWS